MIYTGAIGVVRTHETAPQQFNCHECASHLKDLGYWSHQGREVRLRCINRDCAQCAVNREPVRVPSFSDSGCI